MAEPKGKAVTMPGPDMVSRGRSPSDPVALAARVLHGQVLLRPDFVELPGAMNIVHVALAQHRRAAFSQLRAAQPVHAESVFVIFGERLGLEHAVGGGAGQLFQSLAPVAGSHARPHRSEAARIESFRSRAIVHG